MSRGGRIKDRTSGPERRCIVTGRSVAKSDLIRFCQAPDGAVVPDLAEKLPGRSFWVTPSQTALAKLEKQPGLAVRALKRSATLPENLINMIESLLVERVVTLLSLARKAGLALGGYEKTRNVIETGRAVILIQAYDGAARAKSGFRARFDEKQIIGCLYAKEIGLAFGRDRVIHSVLLAGGLSSRIVREAQKLGGLRLLSEESKRVLS